MLFRSPLSLFDSGRSGCIYYGSFRKDRADYFAKYLTTDVTLSTHSKNVERYREAGAKSIIVPRIKWGAKNNGVSQYATSLYIEDVKTHTYYNHLANRFYEALNYGCTPIFGEECEGTILKSGYDIGDEYIISNANQIKSKDGLPINDAWHAKAKVERFEILEKINNIIKNS